LRAPGKRSITSESAAGFRGAASARDTTRTPAEIKTSARKLATRVNLAKDIGVKYWCSPDGRHFSIIIGVLHMSKLLSILIAAAFATVSVGSFAASHAAAAKDEKKMEKKEEKKAEAKVEKKEEKKEMKKEEKKEMKK
jgi:flagellar biosynthesis component FlhA